MDELITAKAGEKAEAKAEAGSRTGSVPVIGPCLCLCLCLIPAVRSADSWDCQQAGVCSLTVSQIDEMVRSGVISSGMLPKVEACTTALQGGVTKAHIIDGRIPHALMLEIYTEAGIGTEITL